MKRRQPADRHGGNAGHDEEVIMTEQPSERLPAALFCPDCGCRGILPLDQPHEPGGRIDNPVQICPVCETEFRADGVTWIGAVRPPPNWDELSDEEQMANALVMARSLRRQMGIVDEDDEA